MMYGLGSFVEITVPFVWSSLPAHRLLEYTVLYPILPSVLQGAYPATQTTSAPIE